MTLIHSTIADAIAHSRRVATAPLRWDPASHLLSRFAFGATPSSRAWVRAHSPAAWYVEQLGYAERHRGYSGNAAVARIGTLLDKTPYEISLILRRQGDEFGWGAMDQLGQVTLGLQAWSGAQLYETLVDFFANVLNVANHNGDVWNTRHTMDRDVVRRHAMGSYTSMLLASARNPAMLIYLNLAESNKQAVNENYGRELLELHTVGRRYSESDVKNAAKILTGRTVDQYGRYAYDADIHPTGAVKVLGFRHPNRASDDGQAAGDEFLTYLARHPYTASNLATRLCTRFVSDTPSRALVAAVAKSYLDSQTQILPMIATILRSTEFWESRGAKVRRPAENVIATVRAASPAITSYARATATLSWMTSSMNNRPLDWPAPNGYPDIAEAWRSAGNLLDQWNVQLGIAGGWWDGFGGVSLRTLYGRPETSGAAVEALTHSLTGMTFSAAHLLALQRFVGEYRTTHMAKSRLRWLSKPTIGLILHSPHHALR